jgi:alpha-mannosidase
MTLFLYIDNGGDVFVNGDSIGSFEWGTAHFVISENLQAGDSFLIAVRGINKPGWGKVSEFRIEFSEMQDFQERLKDKVWGLIIAQRIAEKLSARPHYWLEKIDHIASNLVQSESFIKGRKDDFLAAFEREGKSLLPLKEEIQKKYTLYCVGYSHIDLAWKWPWVESVEVVKNTTESVLNIMERFPEFNYSMGQAHAYEWMEKYEPNLFKKIQQKVKERTWEIIGGQWVEPDGNLPSGESFVRQSLYAKRFFREKFGVDVKVCWMPDSFGFNWNLPQILARSGIESFITTRVDLDDTRNFPHRIFWWQSPDGSRVLTYIPRDGYMHDLNGEQLVDFLAAEEQEFGSGKELVLYGVGNHGGGPTMEMLERARCALTVPVFPNLKLSTSHEFFSSLSEEEKSRLPLWNSELYLERFRGCYTSQARTKKHNRETQVQIKSAEKMASVASLYGYEYPRKWIFDVWRMILFNQFHDVLPGTSINAVYHDTELDYSKASELASLITDRSIETLLKNIDTQGPGKALVIFNPLSWSRTGPVFLKLDDREMNKEWQVIDENGNTVPAQKVEKEEINASLVFIAKDIPAFGYSVYHLIQNMPAASNTHLLFNRTGLENKYLHVEVDKSSGLITELYDRIAGREILSTPKGNQLQIINDLAPDAWNMRFDDNSPVVNLEQPRTVILEEFGPVRTTIKIVHCFTGEKKTKPTEDFPSSFFTQYISLYADVPYLEVRNHVMWWENQKVLKVAFPVDIQTDTAHYEIPYGSMARSTGFETPFEKARYEVSAQGWADLSDGKYGVALLNTTKHGYDIKRNLMRLTLLRAPNTPDPLADRGYHQFKYALYPHSGDFVNGQVVQKSLEFNEPYIVMQAEPHPGKLGKSHSFLQISPSTVILNVLKMAEDDTDLVVRVFEIAGLAKEVIIKFDRRISSVKEINMIEDFIADINSHNENFYFHIRPYEIRSFKVGL